MPNGNDNNNTPDFDILLEILDELEAKYREKYKDVYSPEFNEDFADNLEFLRSQIEEARYNYQMDMRQASVDLQQLFSKNQQLKNKLLELKEMLESPAFEFATYIRFVEEHKNASGKKTGYSIVDIHTGRGQTIRTIMHEDINPDDVVLGQKILMKELLVVKALDEFQLVGEEATVEDVLEPDKEGARVLLNTGLADRKIIAHLAENVDAEKIEQGASVLVDTRLALVTEVLPENEDKQFLAPVIPDVTFDDIGGLDGILKEIKEDISWSLLYKDLSDKYNLPPAKGFVMAGPPGVGKTLIAKAVANNLAKQNAEVTGNKDAKSFFYHIGGPELLTKWVGESERKIRMIFEEARKKSKENPDAIIVIFFDELDALFRTRGSGISSDMENTIVPALNAELDGLEDRGNILFVGATNRLDMVDKAVTRPGRLDMTLHVPRPNKEGARQIFRIYLEPSWEMLSTKYKVDIYTPTRNNKKVTDAEGNIVRERFYRDPNKVVEYLIDRAVERMYDTDNPKNKFMRVFYSNGDSKDLAYGDFASGAIIANIVRRAKKFAMREEIEALESGVKREHSGIELGHLYRAIEAEYNELKAPSMLDDPSNWLAVEGHAHGKRIVDLEALNVNGNTNDEDDSDDEEEIL